MSKSWKFFLAPFVLVAATVWLAVLLYPDSKLKVVACDVGEGDAFLISYKNYQVLIDGGPDRRVLNCLDKYISFWDRKIELVILSHPQEDHYGGLIEVLKHYDVQVFLTTGLDSSSQDFQLLKSQVTGNPIEVVDAIEGTSLRVGLIYLDILHPSREFLDEEAVKINGVDDKSLGIYTSDKDPNEFSVEAILRYKDFKALFVGDASPELSDNLAKKLTQRGIERFNYIKVPHHGSRKGLTEALLEVVNPKIAVISVGKQNSYGHPNKETLDLLSKYNVETLRTDELGDVEVDTDGQDIWVVK